MRRGEGGREGERNELQNNIKCRCVFIVTDRHGQRALQLVAIKSK